MKDYFKWIITFILGGDVVNGCFAGANPVGFSGGKIPGSHCRWGLGHYKFAQGTLLRRETQKDLLRLGYQGGGLL